MAGLERLDRGSISRRDALVAFNSAFDELRQAGDADWRLLLEGGGTHFSPRRRDRAIGYHVTSKGILLAGGEITPGFSAFNLNSKPSFDVDYKSPRFGRWFREERGVAMEHLIDLQVDLLQSLGESHPRYQSRAHNLAILIACAEPSRLAQATNPGGMVGGYIEAAYERESHLIADNPVRRSRLDSGSREAQLENWFAAEKAVNAGLEFTLSGIKS